jgi:hypothetical protein
MAHAFVVVVGEVYLLASLELLLQWVAVFHGSTTQLIRLNFFGPTGPEAILQILKQLHLPPPNMVLIIDNAFRKPAFSL